MLQYPISLQEGPTLLFTCFLQAMVQDISLSLCAEKSSPRGLLKSL